MKRTALLLAAALWIVGCGRGGQREGGAAGEAVSTAPVLGAGGKPVDGAVREAAVAGLFYPADGDQLGSLVDGLLVRQAAVARGPVRGLICPHAGYRYSGLTAAAAYKQLVGRDVETVVILSASHTATFLGAAIPTVRAFRTPLGLVELSPKAAAMAKVAPFAADPKCKVDLPGDWEQRSKARPPAGQETPHTWDHTIEVQLPFLQRVLKDFRIVPVMYGLVDPGEVADALAPFLDARTVVIASSDLSHEKTDAVARNLDAWCIKSVRELDVATMARQEACGKLPILTLMLLARRFGWQPVPLSYSTTADAQPETKNRVVGYMSFAFVEGAAAAGGQAEGIGAADQKLLLKLARQGAAEAAAAAEAANLDPRSLEDRLKIVAAATEKVLAGVDRAKLSQPLLVPEGTFVTLTVGGQLRGCIGYVDRVKPLYEAVIDRGAMSAVCDTRFRPVRPAEMDKVAVDISVLTTPKPIYYNAPSDLLKRLRPNVDGVVLRAGGRTALFLPLVWKDLPDPEQFMQRLSMKAGLSGDAWRQSDARVLIFQVQEFEETKE